MESWGPPMENRRKRGSPRVPPPFPQEFRLPRPSAGKRSAFPTVAWVNGHQHQHICNCRW